MRGLLGCFVSMAATAATAATSYGRVDMDPGFGLALVTRVWNARRHDPGSVDHTGVDVRPAVKACELSGHSLPWTPRCALTRPALAALTPMPPMFVQEQPGGRPVLILLHTINNQAWLLVIACSASQTDPSAHVLPLYVHGYCVNTLLPSVSIIDTAARREVHALYNGTLLMATCTDAAVYVYDVAVTCNAPLIGLTEFEDRMHSLTRIMEYVGGVLEGVLHCKTHVCRWCKLAPDRPWARWTVPLDNTMQGLWLVRANERLYPMIHPEMHPRLCVPRFYTVRLFKWSSQWVFCDHRSMLPISKFPSALPSVPGVRIVLSVYTPVAVPLLCNAVYVCCVADERIAAQFEGFAPEPVATDGGGPAHRRRRVLATGSPVRGNDAAARTPCVVRLYVVQQCLSAVDVSELPYAAIVEETSSRSELVAAVENMLLRVDLDDVLLRAGNS